MPTDFNIPAIAAWVAEKLPVGHEYKSQFSSRMALEVATREHSRFVNVAAAESMLLDALAAAHCLAWLEVCADGWEVFIADQFRLKSFDGPTRLLALLSAVQAIIDQQQEAPNAE